MLLTAKVSLKMRMALTACGVGIAASIGIAAACALLAQQSAERTPANSVEHQAFAQKSSVAGVTNFGQVNANLVRGAQPTEEGFEQLAKMGVAIVVDLRDDGSQERPEVTKLGMQFVSIPWHCYGPQDESIAAFLSLVRSNPDKKIFVHCRLGTDRTGMMIAAYRMSQQGWSAHEARREMEAFGFSFQHQVICPGLAQYEKDFPHEFSTSPAFEKLRAAAQAAAPSQR